MTWLAVLRLIGGWRAAAFLALAVALGVFAGVQTLRLADVKGDLTTEQAAFKEFRDQMVALTTKAATLAAQARVEYHEASARAESAFTAGRESAIEHEKTVVADLRAGNLRLREQWRNRVCPASEGQAAAGAPEGSDGTDQLRAESAGRIIGIGARADALTAWLQAELLATRQLAESCGKTREQER